MTRPNSNTWERWRASFEGLELGVWKDPEHAVARFLIDQGLATRDDVLVTYRGDKACLRGGMGWFADRRTEESDKRGGTPRTVKWTPNPFSFLPRLRENTPSED